MARRTLTLEDMAHYVIYRELTRLGVPHPYAKATEICKELKAVVTYRAPKI